LLHRSTAHKKLLLFYQLRMLNINFKNNPNIL
jgi:hypothetical protein